MTEQSDTQERLDAAIARLNDAQTILTAIVPRPRMLWGGVRFAELIATRIPLAVAVIQVAALRPDEVALHRHDVDAVHAAAVRYLSTLADLAALRWSSDTGAKQGWWAQRRASKKRYGLPLGRVADQQFDEVYIAALGLHSLTTTHAAQQPETEDYLPARETPDEST